MIEKLIELITTFWESVSLFKIINQYEEGIVLRIGKYHREALPGMCWKIPIFEEIQTVSRQISTLNMLAQTLTTKDDVGVVVSGVVTYKVKNVQPYLLHIHDETDVLNDVVLGSIKEVISRNNYNNLKSKKIESRITRIANKGVKEYGFFIYSVKFADIGRVRSLRLITDGVSSDG